MGDVPAFFFAGAAAAADTFFSVGSGLAKVSE